MAGLGAAINTGGVSRGDSVAVIGCGGVGAAAIAGARVAGANKIIAVDIDDRKLSQGHRTGRHPHDQLQDRRRGRSHPGARPTGTAPTWSSMPSAGRRPTGRPSTPGTWPAPSCWSGVPTPQMTLELPLLDVFGRGGSLKSSWYGDCLPSRDFPMLIDLFLQGRLPLDAFVTETIGIEDIDEAFDKMHGGDVLRSVVKF